MGVSTGANGLLVECCISDLFAIEGFEHTTCIFGSVMVYTTRHKFPHMIMPKSKIENSQWRMQINSSNNSKIVKGACVWGVQATGELFICSSGS